MKALVLDYSRRRVDYREVSPPEARALGPQEVLLRIVEVGVCGTDVKLAEFSYGTPPEGEDYLILGQEAVGEVVEVGSEVTSVQRGDLVTPRVRRPCRPACKWCAQGRDDFCASGRYVERGIKGLHGYFREYAVDEAGQLTAVPRRLAEVAVLLEPLSVVEKAVRRSLELHPEGAETATVIGAGAVGILAALVLQLRGLRVSVTSQEAPDSARVRWLQAAGIRYVHPPQTVPADVVIEAAGAVEAGFLAMRCLLPAGVACLLGGTSGTGEAPFLDLVLHNQVVFGSVNADAGAFAAALADLEAMDGALLGKLIHRESFAKAGESVRKLPTRPVKTAHRVAE